jgi:hypothetical protein
MMRRVHSYLEEREEREKRKAKVRDHFGDTKKETWRFHDSIRVRGRKLTRRISKGGYLFVKIAN